jgi:SAM-dependent methyltransferase
MRKSTDDADPGPPEAHAPADLPDSVARNRASWDEDAPNWVASGRREWASEAPMWGMFGVPESAAAMLPEDLDGLDTLELGCGTGYVSSWLARSGARPVGIDNSPRQLETARMLQAEFGIDFPLHLGYAEALPFADGSFDFAISEYGACLWADPERWVPEAARVLRPGGRLHFLTNSVLAYLCTKDTDAEGPTTDRLMRPQFGMGRTEWPSDSGVEFHLSHGDWIRLLLANGFELVDLRELRAPPDAVDSFPWISAEWARSWPAEDVWKVRNKA